MFKAVWEIWTFSSIWQRDLLRYSDHLLTLFIGPVRSIMTYMYWRALLRPYRTWSLTDVVDCARTKQVHLLTWLIAPVQNLGKIDFPPSNLTSWITNGHKCSTLFREKYSRASSTTVFAPSSAHSIARRKPHGPAPMISIWNTDQCQRLTPETLACATN